MSTRALIEQILDQKRFAVVGVSRDPLKYGYKVFKSLQNAARQYGYTVYAVNPNTDAIDGEPCYPSLDNIPGAIDCVVTITPPEVTEETVRSAAHLKVPYVWMQSGSESTAAFNMARASSMQIVSGGAVHHGVAASEALARQRYARSRPVKWYISTLLSCLQR